MLTYILAGIALVVLGITGYVARMRAATRRLARDLVPGIQAMRRLASQEVRYRPLRSDESIPADAAHLFDQAQRELTAQGLVVLGDLMEQPPEGSPAPTRWFIDKTQTVCGWFGVLRNKAKGTIKPVMMFFSEGPRDAFFITGRGTTGTATAQPATNHRMWLEWDIGLAETLRRHQAQLTGKGGAATEQAATIEAGPALVGRLRERTARWRASRPPRELLEEDVRGLVGDHWDYLGPTVVRLLAADATQT